MLVSLTKTGYSQKCEWLNTGKGKGFKTVYSTTVDDSNFVISVGCFSDSFYIGAKKFTNPYIATNYINPYQGILVKYKSTGEMVFGIQTYIADAKSHCVFYNVKVDSNGSIYVVGMFRGTVDFGNGIILKTPTNNTLIVLIKYNRTGTPQWARTIAPTSLSNFDNIARDPYLTIDYHQNILVGFSFTNNVKFDNSSDSLVSSGKEDIGLVKYSNSGNYVTSMKIGSKGSDKLMDFGDDAAGNLFIAGFSSGLQFGNQTFTDSGYLILKLSNSFNPVKATMFKGSYNVAYLCIGVGKSGKFVLVGRFYDSIDFGGISLTATGKYKKNGFVAYFNANLKPIWAKKDEPVSTALAYPNGVSLKDNYIYFGGVSSGGSETKFGSFVVRGVSNNDMFLSKMDTLGNFLWLFSSGFGIYSNVMDINIDGNENAIISGQYKLDITVFDKSDTGYSALSVDFYVAQISKYTIVRGNVNAGPYCAGDTILIPYNKIGDYADSNHFIAELSDEYGNFEGKERELGRLKTTDSGTIKGLLPLFKVSSSGKYRIRVRSTFPQVQSFYKLDSLRLLIYSRDKADPGLPEVICKGDSIRLNTYGGTKWSWSPKKRMNDSTLRQPIVWPETTSKYKIIIADSSGCGAPDTAFKEIIVRPSLKSFFQFNDTFLCENASLKIPVIFKGGDSTNYKWQWFLVNSPKSFFPLNKGQKKLSDTLIYYLTDPLVKLAVILSDECTSKNDTSYFIMGLRKDVKIQATFNDTVLCSGNKALYRANATGGVSKFYQWAWKDISKNTLLSNSDTLLIVANQTSKIQLIVSDGCAALSDTSEFTLFVNPPLKGSILYSKGSLHDTTLCFGKNLKLFSSGKGGIGSGYSFKWYLDKILLSNADTLNFVTTNLYSSGGGSKTLKLVLADNCTSGSDSVSRRINVIAGPQANFSWAKTCNKTKVPFTFTGSLAALPVTTKYSWHYPDGDSAVVQNPSKLLSKVGKNQVRLILRSSNGCSDVLTKEVDVKQEAIAQFTAADVCEDSAVNFINTSQDAMDYEWKFGDGQSDTGQSPKHLYLISGVTSTFNVSLFANVPAGCSDTFTGAVTINANPKSDFNFTTGGNQVNFTAVEIGASNYQWTFGDGGSTNTTTQTTQYTYSKFPSGKYTACLKVSNIAGCNSQTCKEINITGASNPMIKQQGIKIYPNPNTGSFTVEIPNQLGAVAIEVFNATGQRIYEASTNQGMYLLDLNLTEGVYLIRVRNGESVFNERVMVCE